MSNVFDESCNVQALALYVEAQRDTFNSGERIVKVTLNPAEGIVLYDVLTGNKLADIQFDNGSTTLNGFRDVSKVVGVPEPTTAVGNYKGKRAAPTPSVRHEEETALRSGAVSAQARLDAVILALPGAVEEVKQEPGIKRDLVEEVMILNSRTLLVAYLSAWKWSRSSTGQQLEASKCCGD